MRLRRLTEMLSAAALLASSVAAFAASNDAQPPYPSKPIRIVTSEPGGSGDIVSRLLVPGVTAGLGQPVVVDNRPSVIIAGEIIAKAPPDGYTLITYGGTLWLGPYLRPSPYNPAKDFAPVTLVGNSPCVVLVHPGVAAHSVKELIALAKAQPGKLNYGSGNTGAITHLAVELFKSMAGVNIVRIPYKGAGPALSGLIAGQTELMIATGSSATPHIKSNRLRALAVTGAEPSPLFPGLPTVAATVAGYEAVAYTAILTKSGTPAPIISRLNRVIVDILKQPEVRDRLFGMGLETVASTPEKLGATIKSEMASMGKVIKDANIRE